MHEYQDKNEINNKNNFLYKIKEKEDFGKYRSRNQASQEPKKNQQH